ncbi:anti-sigma factor domain-containing protein [Oceanobacillus sp. CF4.6]|uniref:anti-sigma factor domain-containing protein n=1 Tax=Oceanobacillus sp. CF4.6 TaxID=3373080 RepID=UPI003EE6EE28
MKKGIVLERHRDYTIIMTKDGSFEKALLVEGNADVGEEVSYNPLKSEKKRTLLFSWEKMNIPVKTLSMACIILLFVLPFYFLSGQKETYAYVTVDINPSIEMEVDKDFYVQHIRALNDDASTILKDLIDFKNQDVETIIDQIINKSEHNGMVNEEKNMIVGISYVDDGSDRDVSTVPVNLQSYFSNISGWTIATLVVPKDIREQAKNKETSMNEVMALEIIGEDSSDSVKEDSFDPNDKAIINSFYNADTDEDQSNSSQLKEDELISTPVTDKADIEKSSDTNSDEKQPEQKESNKEATPPHPSELKSENGAVNSNSNGSVKKEQNEGKLGKNDSKDKDNEKRNKNNHGKDIDKDNGNNKEKSPNKEKQKGNNKENNNKVNNNN